MLQTTTRRPHARAEAIMHRIHARCDEMGLLDMKKMAHLMPQASCGFCPGQPLRNGALKHVSLGIGHPSVAAHPHAEKHRLEGSGSVRICAPDEGRFA
jgi:hypothetical protein